MNIVSRRASVQAGLPKKEISVAMSNGIVQLYSHGSALLVITVHLHSPQLRGEDRSIGGFRGQKAGEIEGGCETRSASSHCED